MLRALDDRRPPRFLSDVYEALDAQKPRTEVLSNSVQQELRFVARKRRLACENEILNSPAFEVRTVGMVAAVIVIVMAMVVAASVLVMRSVLMGLKVEPRARV
jgi:anti-sigma-K factor RskA